MATTVKIRRSGTATATPSSLEHGEIAINYADGKVFWKDASNVITSFTFQSYALASHTHAASDITSGTLDSARLDATLAALAGVTTSADQVIYATGSDTFATTALSAFGRSLIDDADAAAARTTLGVQPTASPAFTGSVGIGTSSPGALLEVNGGSGSATCIVKGESGQNAFLSVIGNGNAFLSTSLDIIQQSDNAATIIQRANSSLSFWTNNTTRLTLSSTGTATFTGQILADDIATANSVAYGFDGDTNTGVGRAGADILTLVTGGSERVRVKATGSVRFVPLSADPASGNEAGDVYYNSSTNKLRVYNGTSWVDLH